MELRYYITETNWIQDSTYTYIGAWVAGYYNEKDIVLYSGKRYAALQEHDGNFQPDISPLYWKVEFTQTQISEPIGFDDFKTILKRTKQHGVSAETSIGELEFDSLAFGIIQTAYGTDIDTSLIFKAEIKCVDTDDWTTLYSGLIDLSTYFEQSGDYCSCKVSVGEIGVKTTFNNRVDTEVTVKNGSYLNLDGEIMADDYIFNLLPLEIKDLYLVDKNTAFDFLISDFEVQADNATISELNCPFGKKVINEIGGSPELFNFTTGQFQSNKADNTEFAIFGSINVVAQSTEINYLKSAKLIFYLDNDIIQEYPITIDSNPALTTYNLDKSFNFTQIIDNGQFIECILHVEYKNLPEQQSIYFTASNCDISFRYKTEANQSYTLAAFIHNVLNKIAQITSGLTVKSNYYGKVDSIYNSITGYGSGSLKVLTTGYGLSTGNTDVEIRTNFKDLFINLNSIDNIGWGFSNESGETFIRVEQKEWFYNSNVLMTIDAPANKKRSINVDLIITSVLFGYDKIATTKENYSIDTFHGKKTFTSKIKSISNELKISSKFIADPFIYELTRRQSYNYDKKEDKYNDDIFVICVKVSDSTGQYFIDKGITGSNGSILSPENIINARISPQRNVYRHLNNLVNGVYYQKSESNDNKSNLVGGTPVVETGYTYHGESQFNILENNVIVGADNFLKPELIEFEYPLTLAEYNDIANDPYGIITVDGEDCYLQEIIRQPLTGMCEFKLIPKI